MPVQFSAAKKTRRHDNDEREKRRFPRPAMVTQHPFGGVLELPLGGDAALRARDADRARVAKGERLLRHS